MDFTAAISRGWRMIQLDRSAAREVLGDQDALIPSLVIIAISGVAAAIGQLNIAGIFVLPILMPIFYFVCVGIVHLAASVLGGSGSYLPTYCGYGHGVGLLYWVTVIPIVGPIIGFFAMIWGLVVGVVIVEENYALSRGKAIVAVLVPAVLCCVCAGAAILFFGVASLALFGITQ
jgi:hypothetical protein